jgi:UPF0176 protein
MLKVLLYYKYVPVADPNELRNSQFELCQKLSLKGRILIAEEGLNGTVCGTFEDCEEYKRVTLSDPRFADMEFKESEAEEQVFPKLRVVVRDEIVTLGVGREVSAEDRAEYISPEELNALMHSGEEYYLLDARNNYESMVGKFHNAITPNIDNFRDFPTALEQLAELKNKKIVTYCTGGVRCEKASALMKKMGFEDVKQLHGGIVTYGNEFPDDGWEGKCYVFDKRIALDVNSPDKEVIVSTCHHCGQKSARVINCSNVLCNIQMICCEECDAKFSGGCSEECAQKSRYLDNSKQ